jgi:hypothetical protein
MPDIAASDVSYSEQESDFGANAKIERVVSLSFGDGALTYPAGGVPLTLAGLGMTTKLDSLNIIDEANGNGFAYKYDKANNKLRIYQGDNDNVADAPNIELVGGAATPAAATLVVQVKGY